MMLDLADTVALVERCAPGVAPETLLAIVEVESGFRPLAIGSSGTRTGSPKASNRHAAIATASDLIATGASVDLGLAQINSRNLRRLGLTVADAFEPCRNLAAAATVLREGYGRAITAGQAPQEALRAALSTYNTGHPRHGLANGYVAKVLAAAARYGAPREEVSPETPPEPPPAPPWDVFATRPSTRFVLSFTPGASP